MEMREWFPKKAMTELTSNPSIPNLSSESQTRISVHLHLKEYEDLKFNILQTALSFLPMPEFPISVKTVWSIQKWCIYPLLCPLHHSPFPRCHQVLSILLPVCPVSPSQASVPIMYQVSTRAHLLGLQRLPPAAPSLTHTHKEPPTMQSTPLPLSVPLTAYVLGS